ncbi:MAG: PorT family protein [Bacteroidales bacterium]|nr:PorT family protein [Bacteroidales bacterium]
MKKFLILVIAVVYSTVTVAQQETTDPKSRGMVGMVSAGGNISQFTGEGKERPAGTKLGYQIGLTTYSTKMFTIQPGIFLANKGGKAAGNTVNLNYLQVPVNMLFNFRVDNEWRVILGAGLYVSLGLWGNWHDGTNQTSIKFFDKEDPYRAYDFGWQIFGGAQWGRYIATIGIQPGLARIKAIQENGENTNKGRKVHNNSFTFGLSYILTDPFYNR